VDGALRREKKGRALQALCEEGGKEGNRGGSVRVVVDEEKDCPKDKKNRFPRKRGRKEKRKEGAAWADFG